MASFSRSVENYHPLQQRDPCPCVELQLVVADAEVIELEKKLSPALELDVQLGPQLPGAELELGLGLELTEVADVDYVDTQYFNH